MENMVTNLEVIKECLTQKEWKFLCDDKKGFIAVGFNDAGIIFQVSEEQVEVQTCFFKEVPEEAYHEVSEYLNKVNPILKEGHFKVDPRKGIRYRIVSCVEKGTTIQASRVEEMLEIGSNMGGYFEEVVCRIIDEGVSAEKAFEETILKILVSMEEAA